MPTVPVIAHRGHARVCPENTLTALRSAVAHGVSRVEFDVQLTADHVPVLLHDPSLHRTADLDKEIFDLPLAEAQQISVGEAARFGDQFASERICTLREVAQWLHGEKELEAFVEIKRESADKFGVATTVEPIIEAIAPVLERCIVISFDPRCLQAARELGARRLGYCARALDKRHESVARALQPEFVLIDHRSFPLDGTVALWPGSWQWAAYEVVDPELARQLLAQGFDLIETMAVPELVSGLLAS